VNVFKQIRKSFAIFLRRSIHKFRIKIYKVVLNKEIIHFLHIGKTAGTAMKYAFGNKRIYVDKKFIIVFHQHNFHINAVPLGEKAVFIVRDPVLRFVSGFYSRYRKGMPRIYNPWDSDEEEAFKYFKTPNSLGEALSSTEVSLNKSAVKALQSIGHVNTSYWDWFINSNYLCSRIQDICWVGRQEHLLEDFNKFKKDWGLPKTVKLPKDEKGTHKNPDKFDSSLSDKAKYNLQLWFEKEYEFLEVLKENNILEKSY